MCYSWPFPWWEPALLKVWWLVLATDSEIQVIYKEPSSRERKGQNNKMVSSVQEVERLSSPSGILLCIGNCRLDQSLLKFSLVGSNDQHLVAQ